MEAFNINPRNYYSPYSRYNKGALIFGNFYKVVSGLNGCGSGLS